MALCFYQGSRWIPCGVEIKMRMTRQILSIIILALTILAVPVFSLFAYAQTESSDENKYLTPEDLIQTKGISGALQESVDGLSNDNEALGRVVEIMVDGEYSVRSSFVRRQLTVSKGDVITQSDIDLSKKRLEQIDFLHNINIYYYAIEDIDEPPAIDPNLPPAPEGVGDIVLYVTVYQDVTAYYNPSETGIAIGEKDIFNSGHTLEGAYYRSGSTFEYWHVKYSDPQFLDSHNTATFMISRMEDFFGIRNEDAFDLGERYCVKRHSFRFNLNTLFKEDYKADFGIERQENDISQYTGTLTDGGEKFFLSGEKAPSADDLIFSIYLSRQDLLGDPWITEGCSWAIGTDQVFDGILSDSSFGRYHLTGTEYLPVKSLVSDLVVLHGEYKTTSGDPPHYQKPRLGYLLRGHTGLDYFGDSSIYMSGEVRKLFWNKKAMGVAFIDLGKGFDSKTLTLKNLEMSTGLGIRLDMKRFWNWDVILRLDCGWGETGDRWTFGIGQDIFGGISDIAGGGQGGGGAGCSG